MSKESAALVAVLKKYRGARLVREVEGDSALLLIAAGRYSKIQERWCNEDMDDATRAEVTAREELLEKRIAALLLPYGPRVEFGGDPRGCTVKLHFEPKPGAPFDGRKPANTWGGEESGYGIG